MQNPNKFQRALVYPTCSLWLFKCRELLCSIDANSSNCAVYRSNICDTGLCWKLIWYVDRGQIYMDVPLSFEIFKAFLSFLFFFAAVSSIEKHWRVRDQWGLVLCVPSGHQRPVLIYQVRHMGAQRSTNYRLNVLKNHKSISVAHVKYAYKIIYAALTFASQIELSCKLRPLNMEVFFS
jgi:hypothetical protein